MGRSAFIPSDDKFESDCGGGKLQFSFRLHYIKLLMYNMWVTCEIHHSDLFTGPTLSLPKQHL